MTHPSPTLVQVPRPEDIIEAPSRENHTVAKRYSVKALSRRRRTDLLMIWALRLLVVGAAVGLWQWYAIRRNSVLVPTFTHTVGQLPGLMSSGALPHALLNSNTALVIGYPISAIAGLLVGFVLGRHRRIDRSFSYWLDIGMVVPIIAIVPVVIVALGLGLTARVAVVFLFAMPVIALTARAAIRAVDPDLTEMSRAFGASNMKVWLTVLIPATSAAIFTGLRIGLGRAISGMVVVELVLIPTGLGGLLVNDKTSFLSAQLYAVTLVVLAEGLVLTGVAHVVEVRMGRRMRGAS